MAIRRNLRFTGVDYATLVAGGSGPVAPANLVGGSGWDITNQLGSTAGQGLRGHASGYWVALLLDITASVSGGYLASCHSGGVTGWRIWQDSSTTIRFEAANGAGAFVASDPFTFATGQANLVVGVHTGSQVQLFASRAQVGANVAITGSTPAAGTERMTLGLRNNGSSPHTGARIYGCVGGDGSVPNLTEIQALSDYAKANGDVGTIAGKTTRRYSIKTNAVPPNFPATVTDEIGTDDLTVFTGAASGIDLVQLSSPTWAF